MIQNNKKSLLSLTLLPMLLVCLPAISHAEIYKWVDEKGKVHFTDKPPAKAAPQQQIISGKRSSGKGLLGTRVAKKLVPIEYKEALPTHKVRLERVVVDLAKDKGGRTVIGKSYYGAGCTSRPGSNGYTWSKGRADVNKKKYSDALAEVFKANNYAVVDTGKQLFSEQDQETAELSIAAVIKELEINTCDPSSRRRGSEKVASYIKIEWSLFDNLARKVLLTIETEGSSSNSKYDSSLGDGKRLSRIESFSNATRNLLANQDFVNLLKPGAKRLATPSVVTPLTSVDLVYGKKQDSFTGVISSLKQATVTIRSVKGHGSGFVLTADGYILTNEHVVGDSREAIIVFQDKEKRARVIRVDSGRDVALLKIDGNENFESISLSVTQPVEGQVIYIIGTPLDEQFSHTVTKGIVSAKRKLDDGYAYLQTDAAINPGNSGGPAFNEYGEVVGIAVAGLFNRSGGSLNINFLIPIHEALKTLGL